jgi:hypothetical protein
MWVGILYAKYTQDMLPKPLPLDIVIFYDPTYSEKQIWDSKKSCEDIYWPDDTDESKLERAWDRQVNMSRIYEGTLLSWKDVEAVFHAETLYGDFNNPVLQNLRSFYCTKVKECQKYIDESVPLVENLRIARESIMSGSELEISQQAYKIASILEADTCSPLGFLLDDPRECAKRLGEIGSHDPSWLVFLENLSDRLSYSQTLADGLLCFANRMDGNYRT